MAAAARTLVGRLLLLLPAALLALAAAMTQARVEQAVPILLFRPCTSRVSMVREVLTFPGGAGPSTASAALSTGMTTPSSMGMGRDTKGLAVSSTAKSRF
jgi:hypothetical protein